MKLIKVFLKGMIVECELIEDRAKSVLVKLDDGNIIVRKKSRFVVND